MSLTDVDRLAGALMTLLKCRDASEMWPYYDTSAAETSPAADGDQLISDVITATKKHRHAPLSAAVSLPVTADDPGSRSATIWRRLSVDSVAAAFAADGGGGTTAAARYKTELCRAYTENGACRYADKCQFAHGAAELRPVARHPKYKTEMCRTYHTTGLCPYGPRCHFIHNDDERRVPAVSPSPPAADVDLVARELELQLALLRLYRHHQQQSAGPGQASTSSTATTAARRSPPAYLPLSSTCRAADVRRHHVHAALERHQSLPVSSSSTRHGGPSFLGGSVGSSPSPPSSFAGDCSPPLSPEVAAVSVDDPPQAFSPTSDDERLSALVLLAAKLRQFSSASSH